VAGFEQLREDDIYRGYVVRLVSATYHAPDGGEFQRDVVRTPGAVSVVPVRFDADGVAHVVLVRQYRPPIQRELLEIPAGLRDVPGEAPEETAVRELAEEAGYTAEHLEPLASFHNSAGMSDAHTVVYLATGLRPASVDRHGPEEQHMTVVELPLATAVAMAVDGDDEIADAKTLIGLLLAERRLAGR
jgi:ADP-ribose pyrophosphatase